MMIPTAPIGSIPWPPQHIEAIAELGDHMHPTLDPRYEEAVQDTIKRFEATGSQVITEMAAEIPGKH